MTLSPGTHLGPYEIMAPLGAGGMGEVYHARDTRLEREVAVKVLPAIALRDPDARARFRREALALSRLNHPNIEMVLDIGTHEETDYLVLEFIPGESLASRVSRGRVPEREAIDLGAQIAEALTEAHERGVLHRDLKPGNIMVTAKGRAKVLDFGLAKLAQETGDQTQALDLTQAGAATGTLAYMAPEQLLGETVDPRTDLYAFGVVLYEIVTGKRPFRAALSTALANEILHGRLEPPRSIEPSLSAAVEAVILRAMDRDPARRYQTAAELMGELQRLAAGAAAPIETTASPSGTRRITSIAVLPLENLSGDPEQEHFSDGMTEELIVSLAQVRALRIISRTSAMRYKGQRRPIAEIARELNVDAVVEGSVRRSGDRVRITAQLIDASTERHLLSKSYERDLKEVLALQGEVAAAIVEEIQVSVTPHEESRLRGARDVKPDAYDAYLRGRHLIVRRTDATLRSGVACLEEALRLDPGFVLAHVGLAEAYGLMGFHTTAAPRDVFPKSRAAARKALELDPASSEAWAALAYETLWHEWSFEEAERMFRKSIDINPRVSLARLWFANVLIASGRFDEAGAEIEAARRLDPLSSVAMVGSGWAAYWSGRFQDALVQFRKAVELIPDFGYAWYWLGLASAMEGRDAEATEAAERSLALLGRVPSALMCLGLAHARGGRAGAAREVLGELAALREERYVSSYFVAQVLASLVDRDAAFEALDAAFEERAHWCAALRVDPSMNALRGDPRFDAKMRRLAEQAR